MKPLCAVPLSFATAGAACLGYSVGFEVRSFRLRRVEVPVLPAGVPSLRVLHLSDIHMVSGQRKKRRWLQSLAGLRPDLVVNTGDNLSDPNAVPEVLDALGPLLDFPGAYVFGSNDYYAPKRKNPLRYLSNRYVGQERKGSDVLYYREHEPNPWQDLRDGMDRAGWVGLTNTRGRVKTDNGVTVALTGLDDPHIKRDRYSMVAAGPETGADLALAVVHAPYLRVLDAFTADAYPLILAGHTHGGQVCVPGYGALVTNCDLDIGRVKGLSTHAAGGRRSYLHVSAGCGTNRYTPIRFACPPEATLLTLTERPAAG